MPSSIADRFRRWFEYEKDAHAKVLASLETVPAEKRSSAEYKRAISILGHIAAARGIWLYRLGATPAAPTVMFPEHLLLADVARQLDGIQRLWGDYLAKLTDETLEQTFEYQSLDAGWFRNRIEEILTQLYGHSLYHRGQIAILVKQAGGKPAATDFVYWCRESLEKAP
jgi:uncharacterized damage-inducible protein DinB